MIEKASIYTMNALNKSSELWHTSVNRKARPVVEGEHDKSWNDHALTYQISVKQILLIFQKMFTHINEKSAAFMLIAFNTWN